MSITKFDKNIKIGIIGAGAAGLSAANALKQKGYTDITILEKSDRPGGKSCTFFVDGRSYELGTTFWVGYYKNTRKLFKQFNLSLEKFANQKHFLNLDGSAFKFGDKKIVEILWEVIFRFPLIAFKYRNIYQPGFSGISSELYQPFSTFCRSHKIENIASFLKFIITGYGYGNFDDIPTAYYLKYIRPSLLLELFFIKKLGFSKLGWGTIWSKIAKYFNVIYDRHIIQITSDKNIKIETHQETYDFDKLIIACPLDSIAKVLDFNLKAKYFSSQIQYYDYYCFAFEVDDLPMSNIGYVVRENYENLPKKDRVSLLAWWKKWTDSNIYTFYAYGNVAYSEEDIERNIIKDIEKLGGRIIRKYHAKKWKYFPHVSPEAMKNGFHETLEKNQGENNIYIAGEIMNFSLIETVVEYSNFLVKKYF